MWKLSAAASVMGSPPLRTVPATRVPLVEPRSWIVAGGPTRSTAWRRDSAL
jgi:hypothetical protein